MFMRYFLSMNIKKQDENFISWRYDIELTGLQYEEEFFTALFNSRDEKEIRQVLNKYYFISKPLEELHETIGINRLRCMKNLVLATAVLTYRYAMNFGLETPGAINLLLRYERSIELAKEEQDVRDLRDEIFLTFHKALKENNNSPYSLLVNRAVKYIQDNIRSSLKVSLIANILGCNADYLSHLFMKETGKSLKYYINTRKIRQARILLQSTLQDIQEISDFMGFSSPVQFSRVYERMTGKLPSQDR